MPCVLKSPSLLGWMLIGGLAFPCLLAGQTTDFSRTTSRSRSFTLRFADPGQVISRLEELAPGLRMTVDAANRSLTLTGSSRELAQADELIQRLERPEDLGDAAVLDVELSLLEWGTPPKAEEWKDLDVDALLDGLNVPSGLTLRNDYRLQVIDRVPAQLQIGATVTVRAAELNDQRLAGRGAAVMRREEAGTLVRVTTREQSNGRILVDYQLELSSHGRTNDPQIPAPIQTLTSQSSISVPLDRGVIAGGFMSQSQDADGPVMSRTLILLRVRPAAAGLTQGDREPAAVRK